MKRAILHTLLVVVILAVGALIMVHLISTKPHPERRRPPAALPLVRTFRVKLTCHQAVVKGEGTVRAERIVGLVPQVAGKVIYVSPALVEGGEFENGEVLLRIDPTDYRLALVMARAEVAEAQSQLELLQEQARSAREEWMASGQRGEPPPLLVKAPQLEAARARLKAAQARLKKAELDLDRTVIKAPFSGRVESETVEVGQYVTPGQVLAVLYSREAVEIPVFLPLEELQWIEVPGVNSVNEIGSRAVVKVRVAGKEFHWPGEVVRAGGKVDEKTRLIPVVVKVNGAFGKRPPLMPGMFAQVEIFGRELKDVAVIPRTALRDGQQVWVLDEGNRLRFRPVEVMRFEGTLAIVREGLGNGDRIVLTPLKTVTEGMRVKEAR